MAKRTVPPAPSGPQAPAPPLAPIPVSHHAVTCALSRAEAALYLLRLAEAHCAEGAVRDFARDMCLDVIGDELARAKAAYATAVDTDPHVADEEGRSLWARSTDPS